MVESKTPAELVRDNIKKFEYTSVWKFVSKEVKNLVDVRAAFCFQQEKAPLHYAFQEVFVQVVELRLWGSQSLVHSSSNYETAEVLKEGLRLEILSSTFLALEKGQDCHCSLRGK